MARIIGALTLLLVFCTYTHAQDVAPGDLIRLTLMSDSRVLYD